MKTPHADNENNSALENQGEIDQTQAALKTHTPLYILWGSVIAFVLLLVLFFSPSVEYACKKEFVTPIFLALSGMLVFFLLFQAVKRIAIPRFFPLCFGLLFLVCQLYLVTCYVFKTDWDSGIITYAAELIANGDFTAGRIKRYFGDYPNNVLLTYCFSKAFSLCLVFHLPKQVAYMLILGVQCVISFATGLITFDLTRKITKSRGVSFFVYLIYLFMIGLSPWVSIPYSDSVGIFFPAALVWLSSCEPASRSRESLRCFAIGLLAYLGYQIKPTVFIAFLAMVLLGVPFRKPVKWRELLRKTALVGIGLACAVLLMAFVKEDFGYELDGEKRLGMAHFLAMGHNEKEMGIWAGKDVLYSESFATKRERDLADLQLAKDRIAEMGSLRLLKLYAKKLLTTYGDGTFAWWQEGEFCVNTYESKNAFSDFVRSFYYRGGSRYWLFSNAEQAVWLSVLILAFFAAFTAPKKPVEAIMITLLGMTLYCLLFEVRARYLFVFAPLYFVLAGCGLQRIDKRVFN